MTVKFLATSIASYPGRSGEAVMVASVRIRPLRLTVSGDHLNRYSIDAIEYVDVANPRVAVPLSHSWRVSFGTENICHNVFNARDYLPAGTIIRVLFHRTDVGVSTRHRVATVFGAPRTFITAARAMANDPDDYASWSERAYWLWRDFAARMRQAWRGRSTLSIALACETCTALR